MKQTTQPSINASINASINFDFQGQNFKPSIRINLHDLMLRKQSIEHIYNLLAVSIGLDAYRHEYDVMIMQEISFSNPTGLACEFITDDNLDIDAFMLAWQQQQIHLAIQPIAQRHLNISDLSQHRDIQNALIESYKAGQATTHSAI